MTTRVASKMGGDSRLETSLTLRSWFYFWPRPAGYCDDSTMGSHSSLQPPPNKYRCLLERWEWPSQTSPQYQCIYCHIDMWVFLFKYGNILNLTTSMQTLQNSQSGIRRLVKLTNGRREPKDDTISTNHSHHLCDRRASLWMMLMWRYFIHNWQPWDEKQLLIF